MTEQMPLPSTERSTVAELRTQAQRKDAAGVAVVIGSVAAGITISFGGIFGVEPRLEARHAPLLDRVATQLAFLGAGMLATSAGCLFAREVGQQAAGLKRQAAQLSKAVVADNLAAVPEAIPAVTLNAGQQQESALIVLAPEEIATLPTSSFVLPAPQAQVSGD